MISRCPSLTAENALSYMGQTVLIELVWDSDPEPMWVFKHIVGVILPVEGVYSHAYFMAVGVADTEPEPVELFFSDIRTIRAIRHRDRHSSGNVLDRIVHPSLVESGAALPARRNSFTVPSNGSTGAAHP